MQQNIYCSTIYNSQNMETTEMSFNRGMEKKDMIHIKNGILLTHKRNEIVPFVEMWMDLNTVIQSEVRKRKTNII